MSMTNQRNDWQLSTICWYAVFECFEKSWDLEEEHLNPMAWLALERIHKFLENKSEAEYWRKRLAESGGEEAVAEEWIEAIESALLKLRPSNEEE